MYLILSHATHNATIPPNHQIDNKTVNGCDKLVRFPVEDHIVD